MTNTIAVAPGHLGATLAQRRDLGGQRARVRRLVPPRSPAGSPAGCCCCSRRERVFRQLVPWLILLASALLAVQEPVRAWLLRRLGTRRARLARGLAVLPVFAASIYGGYFGAGLSVIVLAALGLLVDDSLTRLNATKQAVGFAANRAAAALFLFSGQVHWRSRRRHGRRARSRAARSAAGSPAGCGRRRCALVVVTRRRRRRASLYLLRG